MSELELWQHAIKIGRLVEQPSGLIVVGKSVYEILGKSMPALRNLEVYATDYRDLWPTGIKSGGFPVRSGLVTIANKLRKFTKVCPQYTRENVIKATKIYVEECRKKNYAYMKTSEHFIFKDNSSALEGYCEMVINNEIIPDTSQNIRVE